MYGSYWFLGFLFLTSILAAMAGLKFIRRTVSHETLMNHHDVAAAMLSVVGALYAVVLGLVVVGSLSKFDQARTIVEHEANSLRDIYWLAGGLANTEKNLIRLSCIEYATAVTHEEWKLMTEGKISKKADLIMAKLASQIVGLHPASPAESNLQQSLLNEADEMDDARTARTLMATNSFEPIIWAVLIAGGCVLVVFTYFFGVENLRLQMLMTGLVTAILSLNMVVAAMFAYPFSGAVCVTPVAFLADFLSFEEHAQEEHSAEIHPRASKTRQP